MVVLHIYVSFLAAQNIYQDSYCRIYVLIPTPPPSFWVNTNFKMAARQRRSGIENSTFCRFRRWTNIEVGMRAGRSVLRWLERWAVSYRSWTWKTLHKIPVEHESNKITNAWSSRSVEDRNWPFHHVYKYQMNERITQNLSLNVCRSRGIWQISVVCIQRVGYCYCDYSADHVNSQVQFGSIVCGMNHIATQWLFWWVIILLYWQGKVNYNNLNVI